MKEIAQMAEAHLINVQQEIRKLQDSKQKIEADIKSLTEYIESSVTHLQTFKESLEASVSTVDTSSTNSVAS